MIAQGIRSDGAFDTTRVDIGFGRRAGDRLSGCKEPSSRRVALLIVRCRKRATHAQKPLGFDQRIEVPVSTNSARNDIEQIAMLAGRAVRPFAARAFAGGWTGEAQVKAASLRVAPVSDDPVAADLPAVRQITTADVLRALS